VRKAVVAPIGTAEKVVNTAMSDIHSSTFSDEPRSKYGWVSSPVTVKKRVVDLLQLDSPHQAIVPFKPITGLQIPLTSAWHSESFAQADREKRRKMAEHFLDQKTVSPYETKPQYLWR
jgi:hypothetical protein